MAFTVDRQTIDDLKIVGDSRGNDIFGLFNKTRTQGGAQLLKEMFMYPRSKAVEINYRLQAIKCLSEQGICFPFDTTVFDTIDFYLSDTDPRTRLSVDQDNMKRKFEHLIGSDMQYQQVDKGITATIQFLAEFYDFATALEGNPQVSGFQENIAGVQAILSIPDLAFIKEGKKIAKRSYERTAFFDELFRFKISSSILKLLVYAYELDVFISVGEVSKSRGFAFAAINENEENAIEMEGVYHPLVPGAVPNNIIVNEQHNMIFLTGANMAGKSTFMKTFSIAIYLAHMGFPVPAKSMRFNIQNGMFTTINLADNLNMGFSHFYAEVSRVKKVAEAVNSAERLIVVFDELFRGTNVKDAYEATVAVVAAFANKRKCTFIISTHIIEAGEDLKKLRDSIRFLYLPTEMRDDNKPRYTYTLKEGITSDRHGMLIIENEKILDILKLA